ncbi:hypothetical protein TUM12151_10250 [Morganella morganii]|nr:hypothetical protein TUM12149_13580 [Morganella morganii]GIZ34039.1 hypothetical protein TUM12151_10250 [Morganella morganii]
MNGQEKANKNIMLFSDDIRGNLFLGYENRYLNNDSHIIKRGKIRAEINL